MPCIFCDPAIAQDRQGDVLLTWRRATSRSASPEELGRILPGIETGAFLRLSPLEPRSPVANAAVVLEAVLAQHPKAAVAALVLADAVLARGLKWSVLVPLLGAGLKAGDLRKSGDELVLACHRSVVRTAASAGQIGVELQRRANKTEGSSPQAEGKGGRSSLDHVPELGRCGARGTCGHHVGSVGSAPLRSTC